MLLDERQKVRIAAIHYVVSACKGLGKTKIQKLIYLAQEVFGLPLKYAVQMYHYGPYSFDLEDDLSRMRLYGILSIDQDNSGYGYHVSPILSDLPDDFGTPLTGEDKKALDNAIQHFGKLNAQDLELRATIHFVAKIIGNGKNEDVVNNVRTLKPKFSVDKIRVVYEQLRQDNLLPSI